MRYPEASDTHRDELLREQEQDNAKLRQDGLSAPSPGTVPIEKLRAFRLYCKDGSLKPPVAPDAYDETLELSAGERTIRVHPHDDPAGLFIHFHGGGWALGSVYEQDPYLEGLAKHAGVKVVSVDYPMAPEAEMGELLDTALEAAQKLIAQHPKMPIVLGGESAGAHIALSTLLRLRDEGAGRATVGGGVDGISLAYGLYDLSMTPSQRNWGENVLAISTPYLEWFYSMALPGLIAEARAAPRWSPLNADLCDLPPAKMIVGELDPVLDDTLLLAKKWEASGNPLDLTIYENAPHGFNGRSTRIAGHANRKIYEWVRSVCGGRRPARSSET